MKPFLPAPKLDEIPRPELTPKFTFIVNYICNSQMISFWILEAENFYSAYRRVFDELSTKNFLEYFRTPEGVCDSYSSEFEIIPWSWKNTRYDRFDYFGNLTSVNHDYQEALIAGLTTTLVFWKNKSGKSGLPDQKVRKFYENSDRKQIWVCNILRRCTWNPLSWPKLFGNHKNETQIFYQFFQNQGEKS